MGYKASCILIDCGVGPGGLGQPLTFDPDATRELADFLGIDCPDRPELTDLDEAWYPRENRYALAVYREGAAVIGGMDWVQPFIHEPNHPGNQQYKRLILERFGQANFAVLALHSVVNFWAYAIYEQGQMIRTRAGSADGGTWLEEGEPLPEEVTPLLNFEESQWRDDRRVWPRPDVPEDEWETDDSLGESFVFAVASRWIGAQFDSNDSQVERFSANPAWLLPATIETVWGERIPWWQKLFRWK